MNEHDDFVAALMVGAFTLYEDFGFKYWLAKAKTESDQDKPKNIFEPRKKQVWEQVAWLPIYKRPKVLETTISPDSFWY
jgi:hypothetical protein